MLWFFLTSGAFSLSVPCSALVLEPSQGGCAIDAPFVAGNSSDTYSLHFDCMFTCIYVCIALNNGTTSPFSVDPIVVVVFQDRVSVCCPGHPGIRFEELRVLFASQVLGLTECATPPSK